VYGSNLNGTYTLTKASKTVTIAQAIKGHSLAVRRHITADHPLTAGTAILRANVTVNHDAGRDVFLLFTHFITDVAQYVLAVRAVFG
jgi:hypothetical protein